MSKKIYIFLMLIFSCSLGMAQNIDEQFLLSSGGIGGNYNRFGNFLVEQLDSIYPNYIFRNITSSGSLENVRLIDERFTDFAIAQRDVLLESIYDEVNGIKNIELILPLFKENMLVYVNGEIGNFISFKSYIKNIKTIGVTSEDGYSYQFFEKICRLLNINSKDIVVVIGTYQELAIKMQHDELDAITSFSLPIKELEQIESVSKLGFSDEELHLVTSKITNVFATEITDGISGTTVGSWTFLVGLDTSISLINNSSNVGVSNLLIQSLSKNNSEEAKDILSSIAFFDKKENHKLLYGVPLTKSLGDTIRYESYYVNRLFLYPSLFFLIVFIGFLLRKQILTLDYQAQWIRYKHIIIGILCIVGCYFLSVEGLLFAEKEFYTDLGIKSKVLNLTRVDLHFWIIVTNLTGNNNNIFPLSYIGQLMLSFSSYILLVGSIIVAFWEFIMYKLTKKRYKGKMQHTCTHHIVIIGWKDSAGKFLQELIVANRKYKNEKKKILCIVEDPEAVVAKSDDVKSLQEKRLIDFVAGDARDKDSLNKANLHKADTVVILAEGVSKEADEKTLLRALAISRYCRKKSVTSSKRNTKVLSDDVDRKESNKYEDSIYIIAELNDKSFSEDLIRSDVNEIINGTEYSKNILTQSMLNHGVSKVLDEVLTYNEYNEFYTIDLKEERFKKLRDRTFDDLLPELRTLGILLIAVRIVFHDDNNNEIIDEERLGKLLEKEGLTRQIIVNPTQETEKNREVDNDDQLIVFCTSASVIDKHFI